MRKMRSLIQSAVIVLATGAAGAVACANSAGAARRLEKPMTQVAISF